jgi:hypothetical protein
VFIIAKENCMRELTASEIQEVNGGALSLDTALGFISAIGAAAIFIRAPAAAAFAAGVVLGGFAVRTLFEL